LTTSDVAAIGKASTVKLTQGNTLGTGIYLGDGQILTAAHVVSGTGTIGIFFDELRIGSATISRVDQRHDLAVLAAPRLESFGLRPITWGDSAALREGDSLVTLGYPAGLPLSVKFGVVSGLRQDGTTQLIQTDASVNPGMSGGPVLDSRGRLVGVNDFISSRYPGLSFAVASTTVRDFLDGRR
jgi:serine protease Do